MTGVAMAYEEGVSASRPAASGRAGYVYFATDTGILYRSNGSTWTTIAITVGGGAPSGSAGGVLDGTYPNPGLAASVAGDGLAETSDVLSVNVDGATIETNSDALRVKAAGIGTTQLANAGPGATGPLGSGSTVPVVTIDAKGRVTALTSTPIAGAGIGQILFDSTLGADTASIDTGAAGIAGGYNILEVWIIARTDDAAARIAIDITVNNDTSSIYDNTIVRNVNTTPTGATSVAAAAWSTDVHGNGGSASYPGIIRLTIPGYTQTTFWKAGEMTVGCVDATAANNEVRATIVGYRATTAISRMKVAAQGTAKLLTGSRLLIIGR